MSDPDANIVEEVRERTQEVRRMIGGLSDRLRRMRRRNREIEEELAAFERDLEQLRAWLEERGDHDARASG